MHPELFLVMVLIRCASVVRVLRFFSSGAPTVFLREGYAGYVTPWRVLVLVLITSFLSSARELDFVLFMGVQVLSCSHNGECWVSVHCGEKAS
jgi:hypothetical protein